MKQILPTPTLPYKWVAFLFSLLQKCYILQTTTVNVSQEIITHNIKK